MQIMRTKKVCKEFELKNVGEYHDLYVQNGTLLLADVFEYFRNMNFILENPFQLLDFHGNSFKKDKSKIRSFN